MRSGTPDSISSVGSAHSSRPIYQQPPQPVHTGYGQAQVGYNQAQTNYAAAQSAPVPGYGQMAGQYMGQQIPGPQPPVGQQQVECTNLHKISCVNWCLFNHV